MVPMRCSQRWACLLGFLLLSLSLGLVGCGPTPLDPGENLGPSFAKVGPGGTTLQLRPRARLLADGSVRIRVEAGCPSGLEVLEALVTVSQDAAFGQAAVPVQCTGKTSKSHVIVTALDGSFEPGPVVVSGFLLVVNPATGLTEQGQDTEAIDLR